VKFAVSVDGLRQTNFMTIQFLGLGGTDEMGASSYLYLLKEGNLLIDAGVRPGGVGEAALPKFELLGEHPSSAMVLTHAHLDHVGALPLVTTKFPRLRIYCTEATARIAALVLADTLKVSTEQGYPLFGPSDMKRALERLRPIPYFQTISDHGYRFTLYPSGHLLGAASVLIESGGRTVFHTGDVSNVATPVVDPAYMPKEILQTDAVVSESTYGDTLLPSRKEQVRTFVTAIGETLRGGGRVLIPSFALGRAQEVSQILLTSMASGLMPSAPIYLDGLTRSVTEAYEGLLPLLPEALRNRAKTSGQGVFITGTVELVKDRKHRDQITASDRPAIRVGCCTPGPASPTPAPGYRTQRTRCSSSATRTLRAQGDVSLNSSRAGMYSCRTGEEDGKRSRLIPASNASTSQPTPTGAG
jgi:Cft2 family RNA processing exonuclease